jgi:hypothetical protein
MQSKCHTKERKQLDRCIKKKEWEKNGAQITGMEIGVKSGSNLCFPKRMRKMLLNRT